MRASVAEKRATSEAASFEDKDPVYVDFDEANDLDSPPLPGPEDKEGCDPNWKDIKEDYDYIRTNVWQSPDCYDFSLVRLCECEDTGPFRVQVRNGKVVQPNDTSFPLPTMEEIFQKIASECVVGCPSRGAVECMVEYGSHGQVEELLIDRSRLAIDEETSYTIKDFQICGESSIVDSIIEATERLQSNLRGENR